VLTLHRRHRLASLGAYLVALAFSRREELDGFVPSGAFDAFDVREVNRALADLVRAGLLEANESGYTICKYASKNETKEAILARKAAWASRQGKRRGHASITRDTPGHTPHEATRDTLPSTVRDVTHDSRRQTLHEGPEWSQTHKSELKLKELNTKGEREHARVTRAAPPGEGNKTPHAETGNAEAWARGIEHATGAPCTVPTARWELGAIHRATLTHFKGKRCEELLAAIRESATAYAKDHAGKIRKAESWLAWLNSNRPSGSRPAAQTKPAQQPFDENAPWFKAAGETE
jgi:hypothetical protein